MSAPPVNFCHRCGAPAGVPLPFTCAGCGQPHYLNPRPTGCALVMTGGKLLLVKRGLDPWAGRWDIPGGFCDGPERQEDAARREVLEEAGVTCELGAYLGAWVDVYDDGLPTLNAYFHASADSEATGEPDGVEVTAIGWFAPDEVPDAIAFPDSQRAVLAAWRASL